MSSSSPIAICGSFSFDSVIAIDGTALTGKVGGNALWSAMGALLAGMAPRIVTIVGEDFPREVIERLASAGVDTSAITSIDRPHPVRLTFAHLADGGRLQPVPDELIAHLDEKVRSRFVDTTTDPSTLEQGAPTPAHVPTAWLDEITHWHLPLLPWHRHRALVELLSRARGTLHTDCPARSDLIGAPYERLARTLPDIDVFLPSTSDFDVIDPSASLDEVVPRLLSAGANTVVVKSGSAGSVVVDQSGRRLVPAHPDEPVDPTGAGDAFCGGFLAGRATGLDLTRAAALGAAVASFAVAVSDPLDLLEVDVADVEDRARALAAASVSAEALQGGAR